MKKVAIIGHFGGNGTFLDGQTVKTKTLYSELSARTNWEIIKVDTYYKNKNPIKLIYNTFTALLSCKDIIILLSQNGMKLYFPLLYYWTKIFKSNIYHDIIGGNLSEHVTKHRSWIKYLNSFKVNWIEYNGEKFKLEKLGLNNVDVLANFKNLRPVDNQDIRRDFNYPYQFCTFSRVSKEKGILDAIKAIEYINSQYGREVARLDIYGQIDESFLNEFKEALGNSSESINYRGTIDYEHTTETLKNYYALLFPTYFYGEGFPGTVIDAYASGIPVIATDWHANKEIINNFITGIVYPCKETPGLKEAIEWVINNPNAVRKMKKECIEESKKYQPNVIISHITSKIEEDIQ